MNTVQNIYNRLTERFGAEGIALAENASDPKRGDACVRVPPKKIRDIVLFLRDAPGLKFEQVLMVTGLDCADHIDVVYHLRSYSEPATVALKASVPRDGGAVPSIADIHPAADWHERETFDLIGVRFDGHPNLRRILLPEDWEGYPLRKDYKQPDEYHGVTNL
ncbi:MAG: NADH-quinone oxidoreductase subunit C [Candidatus Sumerlaeota bacterium]|nr:NADH-quinone oxidoreductase subunit C [Candidatus Sumerlaeota bacterium]